MKSIKKIVIKSTSGYCPYFIAYTDKLILEVGSISYEYKPYEPSEENKPRKWSYKTDNEQFKRQFEHICEMLPDAINLSPDMFCTDLGETEFSITYEDGSREKKEYVVPGEAFGELFPMIKELVPAFEEVPEVIKTGDE